MINIQATQANIQVLLHITMRAFFHVLSFLFVLFLMRYRGITFISIFSPSFQLSAKC